MDLLRCWCNKQSLIIRMILLKICNFTLLSVFLFSCSNCPLTLALSSSLLKLPESFWQKRPLANVSEKLSVINSRTRSQKQDEGNGKKRLSKQNPKCVHLIEQFVKEIISWRGEWLRGSLTPAVVEIYCRRLIKDPTQVIFEDRHALQEIVTRNDFLW